MCPQVPPAAKITTGPNTRCFTHTRPGSGASVRSSSCPDWTRIYGVLEHSIAEFDIAAKQIYTTVVVQVPVGDITKPAQNDFELVGARTSENAKVTCFFFPKS